MRHSESVVPPAGLEPAPEGIEALCPVQLGDGGGATEYDLEGAPRNRPTCAWSFGEKIHHSSFKPIRPVKEGLMQVRQLRRMIGCVIISASLANCAGWQQRIAQFDRDESSKACVAAGYAVTHPRHEECIANTTAARKAQGQREAQETIFGGLLLGSAIKGAAAGGGVYPMQPTAPANPGNSTSATPGQGSTRDQAAVRLCPNGSYVYGNACQLAPNGQYLPGPATLAPNGQYVTGRPQMAPNGSYVGGNGPVSMCPDGSYVAGSRCVLTPNGTYVGAP